MQRVPESHLFLKAKTQSSKICVIKVLYIIWGMCVCMHVIHIRPILVSFCYWRQFYMQKPYHHTPDGNQGETSSSWSPPYLSHPSLPLDKFWKSQSQSSGWYLTSNIFQKQSLTQLFGIMIVNLIWSFDWSMGCLLNIIFEYVYYGDSMGVFCLN